jgi:hypothetical protein
MDIVEFMRHLEGTKYMNKRRCITMDGNILIGEIR